MLADAVRAHLETTSRSVLAMRDASGTIVEAARLLAACLEADGKILWCGNGGSAGQAQHLSTELVVRLAPTRNRRALASIALSTDTSLLTACANDYGYEQVFARQVEALGRKGDVLVGMSTSGNSGNVVKAFEAAKERGMSCLLLAGKGGGRLKPLADVAICVPETLCHHIQETHLAVGHLLCDLIERQLFDGEGSSCG